MKKSLSELAVGESGKVIGGGTGTHKAVLLKIFCPALAICWEMCYAVVKSRSGRIFSS